MEILKQRLGRYKEVYSTREIREEIIDVIVPDCNPDYEREICTHAVSKVTDRSMLSGCIRVSGDIRACTHYDAAASESMYLISADTKFSYSFDIPGGLPDDTFGVTLSVLQAETEVLNSRKIRIKAKLLAVISVFRMENTELSADVCTVQAEGVNIKTKDIVQMPCIDIAEKNISFTEEIKLGEEEIFKLSRIIRWSSRYKTEEIKILQNRVMVRGVAQLRIYGWCDSSGRCEEKEYVLPFSQVIECKNVCETDSVEVVLEDNCCSANINARDDGSTVLRCDVSVDARLFAYRSVEGSILLDMYSTEYETQVSNKKVYITEGHTDYAVSLSARDKIGSHNGVNRIIDSRVSTMCAWRSDKVRASFFVSVLYEDGLGALRTARAVLDASADVPQNIISSSVVCGVDGLTVNGEADGISVEIEATVCAKIIQGYFCEQVESCVLDTTQKRKQNTKGNLVLRYPEKDESVWSIAKFYGTTKAAILSANDMEDETQLTCGRLIIIPFVR